jgi:hypothetical protein
MKLTETQLRKQIRNILHELLGAKSKDGSTLQRAFGGGGGGSGGGGGGGGGYYDGDDLDYDMWAMDSDDDGDDDGGDGGD